MSQAHDTGRSGFETMVVGLFRDVRTLVCQEMALARHEVKYEIGKILQAAVWFGVEPVLAGYGGCGRSAEPSEQQRPLFSKTTLQTRERRSGPRLV